MLLAGVVPVAAWPSRGWSARAALGGAARRASGLGFGGVGVASRVLVVPDPWVGLLLSPTAWAIVAYAAVALVCYGLALDRGSVTTTAAVTFAVETVVPSAIGLLLLHDRVRAGYPVAAPSGSPPPWAAASRWPGARNRRRRRPADRPARCPTGCPSPA